MINCATDLSKMKDWYEFFNLVSNPYEGELATLDCLVCYFALLALLFVC